VIVRVERGEMQGNVGFKLARNPLRQRVELLVGIVLTRNEQRRDLSPGIRFVNEYLRVSSAGSSAPASIENARAGAAQLQRRAQGGPAPGSSYPFGR
jgi:hypothetical protein